MVSCGGKETKSTAGSGGKKFKIGTISMVDTSSAFGRAWQLAEDTVAEAAGCEVVRVQIGGYNDEAFVTAYESMINQGIDAAGVFTLSETVLPILKDLFEENKVKFFLFNRKVSTKQMEDMLFSSPMCLGNEHADETQNAYNMVKYLKDNYNIKNLAAIGLTKGDINGDYRDAGIEKACADFGIKLLATTRGIITTEDVTKAVDGLIASYPEMDSIFIVGGTVTQGALAGANQALVNHNLQNKVVMAMVDISTGMAEYMDSGPLKLVAGGNLLSDLIFSMVAVVNALNETPLSNLPIMNVNMLWVTNGADAANYDKYIEGTIPPFSVEEYQKTMFKWLNPSVTLDSVQKIASDFTIESVMARNKDKF
jgi:ABC-type sugar transport system substrate-binding protein